MVEKKKIKRKVEATDEFSPAEIGALAHLYRAEVYRSTVWRMRLDTTTNWSVVTLGVALSITFSSSAASPVPLILVGVLILLFLALEARRYRYFNVWRARARWMETHFYTPMLIDGDLHTEEDWQITLAKDYMKPRFHVSFLVAIARRVRRNYLWILIIQALAYVVKLTIHPVATSHMETIFGRAAIGPVPGEVILGLGALYVLAAITLTIWINIYDSRKAERREDNSSSALH